MLAVGFRRDACATREFPSTGASCGSVGIERMGLLEVKDGEISCYQGCLGTSRWKLTF